MNKSEYERQAALLYSIIVAGKSANFTDKALRNFFFYVRQEMYDDHLNGQKMLPFEMLRNLTPKQLVHCIHKARTGNYGKLQKAIMHIVNMTPPINLLTVTPEQLEEIHGIGPKTSRFFIMWIRPTEIYAALDVHILRWMKAAGYDVPKATPQNKKTYARIEKQFIERAQRMGLTPRELDIQIWEAGAGRTQKTPLPEK